MVLGDTSVWVDHFRSVTPELRHRLNEGQVLMHPFVIAELALGSLPLRQLTLARLEALPAARVARLEDVRLMIEVHSLFSRGIGLTDAHLLASAFVTPHCKLWTRDKKLRATAEALNLDAKIY